MMEPMPEGTRALVDDAVDEAAQSLFSAAGVPIARTDELLAAIQGPAVRAALEARIEQIVKHGHDREYDSMLAIGHLPRVAKEMLQAAYDCINATVEKRSISVARRRLARTAALCMAAIDRLDMLPEGERQ